MKYLVSFFIFFLVLACQPERPGYSEYGDGPGNGVSSEIVDKNDPVNYLEYQLGSKVTLAFPSTLDLPREAIEMKTVDFSVIESSLKEAGISLVLGENTEKVLSIKAIVGKTDQEIYLSSNGIIRINLERNYLGEELVGEDIVPAGHLPKNAITAPQLSRNTLPVTMLRGIIDESSIPPGQNWGEIEFPPSIADNSNGHSQPPFADLPIASEQSDDGPTPSDNPAIAQEQSDDSPASYFLSANAGEEAPDLDEHLRSFDLLSRDQVIVPLLFIVQGRDAIFKEQCTIKESKVRIEENILIVCPVQGRFRPFQMSFLLLTMSVGDYLESKIDEVPLIFTKDKIDLIGTKNSPPSIEHDELFILFTGRDNWVDLTINDPDNDYLIGKLTSQLPFVEQRFSRLLFTPDRSMNGRAMTFSFEVIDNGNPPQRTKDGEIPITIKDPDQVLDGLLSFNNSVEVQSTNKAKPLFGIRNGEGISLMRFGLNKEQVTKSGWTRYRETFDLFDISPGGEGLKTVFAQFTFKGGQTLSSGLQIIYDISPPVLSFLEKPGEIAPTGSQSFSFSGEEGVRITCSLDDRGYENCANPVSYDGLAPGDHTLSVVAIDDAENTSPIPLKHHWSIDGTVPETTIELTPPFIDISDIATFSFFADETDAVFYCSLNEAEFDECNSPKSFMGIGDGSHIFTIYAKDPAGNIDPTPSVFSWTIDTTAPIVTIVRKPAQRTNNQTETIEFTTDTPKAILECSLDSKAFQRCTSPVELADLSEGSHSLEIKASDDLGNLRLPFERIAWSIDLSAPNLSLSQSPPSLTNIRTATFVFSADGEASFKCTFDDGTQAGCSSPLTYTNLGDGEHWLSIAAVDDLGNLSVSSIDFVWTIDTMPPTKGSIVIEDLDGDGTVNDRTPTIDLVSTGASSMRFGLSESALISAIWSPFAATYSEFDIHSGIDGMKTVFVEFKDAAGNIQLSHASSSIILDSTPPAIGTITIVDNNGLTKDPMPQLSLTSTGADYIRLAPTEAALLSATWIPFTSEYKGYDLSPGGDGTKEVFVEFKDRFGNIQPVLGRDQTIFDSTPPGSGIIAILANTGSTNKAFPTIEISSDGASLMRLALSEEGLTFSPWIPYRTTYANLDISSGGEGTKTIFAEFMDAVGNVQTNHPDTQISYDITAPGCTIVDHPAPQESGYDGNTFSFSFISPSDPNALFECRSDSSAFLPCTSPVDSIFSTPGNHSFSVRAIDPAGNATSPPARFDFTILGGFQRVKRIGGTAKDQLNTIARDLNGNILFGGDFRAPLDFGADYAKPSIDIGNADGAFLTVVDGAGQYQRTLVFSGTVGTTINKIKFDQDGNVYLCGDFAGSLNFGVNHLLSDIKTSNGATDAFVTRMNLDGSYAWTRSFGGSGADRCNDLVIDRANRIKIVGIFFDIVDFAQDFGSSTDSKGSIANSSGDGFFATITTEGQYISTKIFGSPLGLDTVLAVDVSTDGSSYLAGRFFGSVDFAQDFGSSDLKNSANGNNWDGFITAIDRDGIYRFTHIFGGPDNDEVSGLIVDHNADLLIFGTFKEMIDFARDFPFEPSDDRQGHGPPGNENQEAFVTKLSPSGSYLWSRSFGGIDGLAIETIGIDRANGITIAGWFKGEVDFGEDFGVSDIVANHDQGGQKSKDIFLLCFDETLDYRWTKSIGGLLDDTATGLLVEPTGYLLGGTFSGTVNFAEPFLDIRNKTSQGSTDIFTLELQR